MDNLTEKALEELRQAVKHRPKSAERVSETLTQLALMCEPNECSKVIGADEELKSVLLPIAAAWIVTMAKANDYPALCKDNDRHSLQLAHELVSSGIVKALDNCKPMVTDDGKPIAAKAADKFEEKAASYLFAVKDLAQRCLSGLCFLLVPYIATKDEWSALREAHPRVEAFCIPLF